MKRIYVTHSRFSRLGRCLASKDFVLSMGNSLRPDALPDVYQWPCRDLNSDPLVQESDVLPLDHGGFLVVNADYYGSRCSKC